METKNIYIFHFSSLACVIIYHHRQTKSFPLSPNCPQTKGWNHAFDSFLADTSHHPTPVVKDQFFPKPYNSGFMSESTYFVWGHFIWWQQNSWLMIQARVGPHELCHPKEHLMCYSLWPWGKTALACPAFRFQPSKVASITFFVSINLTVGSSDSMAQKY